jgi:hypothetical protein
VCALVWRFLFTMYVKRIRYITGNGL